MLLHTSVYTATMPHAHAGNFMAKASSKVMVVPLVPKTYRNSIFGVCGNANNHPNAVEFEKCSKTLLRVSTVLKRLWKVSNAQVRFRTMVAVFSCCFLLADQQLKIYCNSHWSFGQKEESKVALIACFAPTVLPFFVVLAFVALRFFAEAFFVLVFAFEPFTRAILEKEELKLIEDSDEELSVSAPEAEDCGSSSTSSGASSESSESEEPAPKVPSVENQYSAQ